MKKWVLPTIVVVIVLSCGGFGVVAMTVLNNQPIYSASSHDPEWAALSSAESKGEAGYEELQDLMKSASDDYVTSEAGRILASGSSEGIDLFFEAYLECSPRNQDSLASSHYYDFSFWNRIAELISEEDSVARDGAEFFVRIAGTRYMSAGQSVPDDDHKIADALIDAIPRATGEFAEYLPYTISLYLPSTLDGLIEFLDHDDAKVRRIAVAALGRLEAVEVKARIEKLKTDSDKEVRLAAFTAIDTIDAAITAANTPTSGFMTGERGIIRDEKSERENAKNRLGIPD